MEKPKLVVQLITEKGIYTYVNPIGILVKQGDQVIYKDLPKHPEKTETKERP